MTPQEVRVWCELRLLRPEGLHVRRQVPIGRYIVDFACRARGVVVEFDGSQHGDEEHAEADRQRDAALAGFGYLVLRFWNQDIDSDIGSAVDHIVAMAQGRAGTRHVTPSGPRHQSQGDRP